MVKFVNIILLCFTCTIACKKNISNILPRANLTSEYFDTETDEYQFEVFGTNKFLPLDTERWVKIYDTSYSINYRIVGYNILHRTNSQDQRDFILEPNKLKSSSEPGKDFLSFYKSYKLLDTSQSFYYERSGIYSRYNYSKIVNISTNFYTGPGIWSYIEYTIADSDSTSIKTIIDEYYGRGKGLVKINQEELHFERGKFISKTILNKRRVR